ncbi:hypothetical protein [Dawidia soli]|uniref:Uncharacterized protein n=1 Tax=Dawidia soli TaxID=2782352 RepID=A0AAP2DGI7_9BACT|nr:hypothetical protein [Dawidia soli]MBT1690872.1 hypothetical protein [Dawidia soli]
MKKRPMMMRSFAVALVCTASVALTNCANEADQIKSSTTASGEVAGNFVKGTVGENTFQFAQSPGASVGNTDSYYIVRDNGDIDVNIFRNDGENGAAMLYFVLKNGDVQNPSEPYMQITNADGFVMDSNAASNKLTVTNFSFDRSTGRVSGKLQLSGAGNNLETNTSVSSDFDVVVKEIAI